MRTATPTSTETPTLVAVNGEGQIALRGTRLTVTLAGMAQKGTLEQTFVNQEQVAIEAVYTFPLPPQAAVCGFEVVTGDRVLTGCIEDAEKALEQYDEAVSDGHAAYLMDQDRPDIFTLNVGNLKPGQAVTIRIRFVAPLEFQERRLRLAYPTTIAPRYVTATGQADPVQAEIDGEVINPPHVLAVPYGLSFEMSIQLGRKVAAVTSPSHTVQVVNKRGAETVVTLAAGVTAMNRDLVIAVELARDATPVAQAGTWSNPGTKPAAPEHFVAVTFIPELDQDKPAAPQPQEVVFVLDCSGSMDGDSIGQAKRALELCLRSLNTGDHFNICKFGSTFKLMSPTALLYSEATLAQALTYVQHIKADLGGTELHPALDAILASPVGAGPVRSIVLLTDGEISNDGAVLDLARRKAASNRIFSFGIGAACSHSLVHGLAEATGGAPEFITGNERIEEKVLRTFSRIGSPVVTDVTVDWGGGRVRQAPATLSALFDGDPLAVCACIEGELPGTVTLRCTCASQPCEWTVPVQAVADNGTIALLWAKRALADLTVSGGEPAPAYSRRRRTPQARRDDTRIVTLSKRFGLLCAHTSFIAVEHRSLADRNEGAPELRRVPVQLAAGWHGIDTQVNQLRATCIASSALLDNMLADVTRSAVRDAAPPASAMRHFAMRGDFRLAGPAAPMRSSRSACYDALSPAPPPPREFAERAHRPVFDLLATQTADGWFDWPPQFDVLFDHAAGGLDALRERLATEFSLDGQPDSDRILGTLAVLWLLLRLHASDRVLWRKAAAKALRRLAPILNLEAQDIVTRIAAVDPQA